MGVNEGVQLLCSSEPYMKQASQGMPLHKLKTWPNFLFVVWREEDGRALKCINKRLL